MLLSFEDSNLLAKQGLSAEHQFSRYDLNVVISQVPVLKKILTIFLSYRD
jgi:hypothetical protein